MTTIAYIEDVQRALRAALDSGHLANDSEAWLTFRVSAEDYAVLPWPEDREGGTKTMTIGERVPCRSGRVHRFGISAEH